MTVHESPDAAIRAVAQSLILLKKEHGEKAYYREIRKLCLSDFWFLVRVVLEWGFMDEELHGKEILEFYADADTTDTALFIPRGHVKSMTGCARQIQRILRNPNVAILAASATEGLAQDVGGLIAQHLMGNEWLRKAFADILPKSENECRAWGKPGYRLPCAKPRTDPTLFCTSVGANVTGRHPDVVWVDDLIIPQTNNEKGWLEAENFILSCLALLPPHGILEVTGTRYHDSDPYKKMIDGIILGNRGQMKVKVLSCWRNDNPKSEQPIYPEAVRWNMSEVSGFSHELLKRKQHTMRAFFNAQYRNNPTPEEEQRLKLELVNVYVEDERPRLSEVKMLGIDITGGGKLIHAAVQEKSDKLLLSLPLFEVTTPRSTGGKKVEKEDRIIAALEPVISEGRLYALGDMKDTAREDTLGHEIRKLGSAAHDDIVDALHQLVNMVGKNYPRGPYAEVYIAADVAYSEKDKGDYTVLIAAAVDKAGNVWVLGYDRFQVRSPTGIADRIVEFYRRWDGEAARTSARPRKSFGKSYT